MILRRLLQLLCVLVLTLLVGCASTPPPQKAIVVILPDSDGNVGVVEVSTDAGTQVLDRAGQSTTVAGRDFAPTPAKEMTQVQIDEVFGAAIKAKPLMPETFILYFESGQITLTAQSRQMLNDILAAISKREQPEIAIVRHTDAFGSDTFNLELSLERAQMVRKELAQRSVPAEAMEVSSHGEQNPLVPTLDSTA